jgi:hypothetical protein
MQLFYRERMWILGLKQTTLLLFIEQYLASTVENFLDESIS